MTTPDDYDDETPGPYTDPTPADEPYSTDDEPRHTGHAPDPFGVDGDLTEILAATFRGVLAGWLTPSELAAVDARNRDETRNGVCHSHDFCDANMAMWEAFTAVYDREPNTADDDDTAAWNAAWSRAIDTGFSA